MLKLLLAELHLWLLILYDLAYMHACQFQQIVIKENFCRVKMIWGQKFCMSQEKKRLKTVLKFSHGFLENYWDPAEGKNVKAKNFRSNFYCFFFCYCILSVVGVSIVINQILGFTMTTFDVYVFFQNKVLKKLRYLDSKYLMGQCAFINHNSCMCIFFYHKMLIMECSMIGLYLLVFLNFTSSMKKV
eukprot:TRINITY_DN15789_c0_g2_i1.p1 TRINITY_DN15789_c0_g2~~TRINITY_DN15789_c0_g2_i1.p1  ORF type:complete len:187 (-),score=-4.16 TRINITY_DN15789_c0_g2_i1:771-1331(-)